LLKEIKADSGWWANKYAYQIGFKGYDIFKIKNLSVQTEYNYCRPFTYSHGSPQQNHGHFNQSLAHPIGANFKEWVNFVRYNYKWIYAEEQLNLSTYGTDTSYQNYGGNIFQSYRNRVHDYHNYTGQGNTTHVLYHKFTLGFLINPDINLRLELGHAMRRSKDEFGTSTTNWIFVTLKTNLFNQYLDY